jgi:hypothetical protein
VLQLGNCRCSGSGRSAHADAARRALRAAGVMGLLTERLRACPAGDNNTWVQAAQALAAMIEVGDTSGGAASAGQPGPQLLGQEDDAALELLLQGLLSARAPERQAQAASALALLLERSSSVEVAAHMVQRGALGRARQLAASSAASPAALECASLLLEQLEELVEPEELEVLEVRCRRQQQEGLRARGAGAEAAGLSAGGSSSAGRQEGEAAAGAAAASSLGGVCAACGAAKASGGAKLRKCAGCLAVRYCSLACQKAHWREHREACKAAQQAQGAK